MRRQIAVAPTIIGLSCILPQAGHSHDIFPGPGTPGFNVEQIATNLAKAEDDAKAAQLSGDLIATGSGVWSAVFLWRKSRITACFWNGDPSTQQHIIQYDDIWEGFSQINVNYIDATGAIRACVDQNSADIRISLNGDDPRLVDDYDPGLRPAHGNWSTVGSESISGQHHKVTVNLHNINMTIPANIPFLSRHELGHARGLLHEHQRKRCEGMFNIDNIMQATRWERTYATSAVAGFEQMDQYRSYYQPTAATAYDVASIMQYNFASNWYNHPLGQTNPCERDVTVVQPSQTDKDTLIRMYGAVGAASGAALVAQDDESLISSMGSSIQGERKRIADLRGASVSGGGPVGAAAVDVSKKEDALNEYEKVLQSIKDFRSR